MCTILVKFILMFEVRGEWIPEIVGCRLSDEPAQSYSLLAMAMVVSIDLGDCQDCDTCTSKTA
jgi:hypothetical protein